MVALACLLHLLTAEGLPIRRGSQVDNTQVNSQGIRWRVGGGRGNLKGHGQVPCSFAVQEVGLPLDTIHTSFLIASNTKRYQYSAREGQEGNSVESLEGHHPFIVGDSAFWLEMRLNALLALVNFTGLADTANSQLSRQFVGRTQFTIHNLLQCKLVGGLLVKSDFSHIVGRCIKSMHGIKQGLVLFSCWCKLQEHRLFHRTRISTLNGIVNSASADVFLSSRPLKGDEHPERILVIRNRM